MRCMYACLDYRCLGQRSCRLTGAPVLFILCRPAQRAFSELSPEHYAMVMGRVVARAQAQNGVSHVLLMGRKGAGALLSGPPLAASCCFRRRGQDASDCADITPQCARSSADPPARIPWERSSRAAPATAWAARVATGTRSRGTPPRWRPLHGPLLCGGAE